METIDHDADEGVIAAAIGDRAADEGEDRERQPRGLVGPKKRMPEVDAGKNIGQDEREFGEQGEDDDGFRDHFDGAQCRGFRRRSRAAGWDRYGNVRPRRCLGAGKLDGTLHWRVRPMRRRVAAGRCVDPNCRNSRGPDAHNRDQGRRAEIILKS